MAKGPMYVKDFDFSVKPCNYSHGGSAKMTKMASGGYYAKGGLKEPATGETYPSRKAMMKHEAMETPRMQKEEMVQSRMVKAPAMSPKAPMRRAMPVASSSPLVQMGAMKKGGFVEGGKGMLKPEGTLGIKGNKNPGEMNGKPTTATKTGNVPYKKGGKVAKVMGEFKAGELHSGSKKGPMVKNPKQAIAIALSEARAAKKKK